MLVASLFGGTSVIQKIFITSDSRLGLLSIPLECIIMVLNVFHISECYLLLLTGCACYPLLIGCVCYCAVLYDHSCLCFMTCEAHICLCLLLCCAL